MSENPKTATPMLFGNDLKVYLNAEGGLVLTTTPREGLTKLDWSSDVTLRAPIDGVIVADVTILVSEIDVELLPANARFCVNGNDIDAARFRQISQWARVQMVRDHRIYRIYSREHNAWWKPNECGYTVDVEQAGLYTFDQADRICRGAGPLHDGGPAEFMVTDCIPPRNVQIVEKAGEAS